MEYPLVFWFKPEIYFAGSKNTVHISHLVLFSTDNPLHFSILLSIYPPALMWNETSVNENGIELPRIISQLNSKS